MEQNFFYRNCRKKKKIVSTYIVRELNKNNDNSLLYFIFEQCYLIKFGDDRLPSACKAHVVFYFYTKVNAPKIPPPCSIVTNANMRFN